MKALLNLIIDPDKVTEACRRLIKFDKILKLFEVTGEYDVVALVETESIEAFRRFLEGKVLKIDGIRRTETYIILEEWK